MPGPARDAAPLVEPAGGDHRPDDSGGTTRRSRRRSGSSASFAHGLSEVLAGAHRQYGFASHEVMTIWLGTSTGVRRRWVQPTGSVELNAKTPDLTGSAWAGLSTTDFGDVDVVALAATAARRLEWGSDASTLPAGRYETLLPPSAVSDLMIYLAWSMEGRPAQEGRSALAGSGRPARRGTAHRPATHAVLRPGGGRAGVRAVPHRDPIGRGNQRLRQRRADPPGGVDQAGRCR